MIKTLVSSVMQLVKLPKIVLVAYLVSLVLSLLIARPFYSTLISEANHSVALDQLVGDFDFMIFSDFIVHYGNALMSFVSMIFVVGFLYLVINAFLAGGFIGAVAHDNPENHGVIWKMDFKEFFGHCLCFFGRYLWLTVYTFVFLVVVISFAGMFFFIFASIAEGGNEKTYILAMIPPIIILLMLIGFVITVSDYAKTFIYTQDLKAWDCFWKGMGFVLKNPKTLMLFWLIILWGFVIIAFYFWIDHLIGMHSGFTILIMFIIQQMVVYKRIFLKVLTTTAAYNYVAKIQSGNGNNQ